jgi:ketosteroid isomerase-like protein
MMDDRWALFDLVGKFDDAVNRRDIEEFRSLWADDAVWEIGEPMPMRIEGAQAITEKWSQMIQGTQWLFRGSFTGVVVVDGDVATGRWPCIETGTFINGAGYDNRALYEDVYVRLDGRWLFQKRSYVYLWLSNETLPGAAIQHLNHQF